MIYIQKWADDEYHTAIILCPNCLSYDLKDAQGESGDLKRIECNRCAHYFATAFPWDVISERGSLFELRRQGAEIVRRPRSEA